MKQIVTLKQSKIKIKNDKMLHDLSVYVWRRHIDNEKKKTVSKHVNFRKVILQPHTGEKGKHKQSNEKH